MAEKKSSPATTLVLASCCAALLVLFIYLWTYPYNPQRIDSATSEPRPDASTTKGVRPPAEVKRPAPPARLAFHLGFNGKDGIPIRPNMRCVVRMSLKNVGDHPARLLDADAVGILYAFELSGPDGKRIKPKRPPFGKFAREFKTIELLPGRSLVFEFDICSRYDLAAPGRYLLRTVYQPQRYMSIRMLDSLRLRVSNKKVFSNQINFTLKASSPLDGTDGSTEKEEGEGK